MAYFSLPPNLRTGIADIDQQHQSLADLLTAAAGQCLHDVGQALQSLDTFLHTLQEHCAVEEALLENIGYEHFHSHAQGHRDAVAAVQDLRAGLAAHSSPDQAHTAIEGIFELYLHKILRDDVDFIHHFMPG